MMFYSHFIGVWLKQMKWEYELSVRFKKKTKKDQGLTVHLDLLYCGLKYYNDIFLVSKQIIRLVIEGNTFFSQSLLVIIRLIRDISVFSHFNIILK